MAANPHKRELVVLVHGIASNRWLVWPLARRLSRMGYTTRIWSYVSVWGSNRKHGERLAQRLREWAASGEFDRIHLAVHSMGAIVTRCALSAGAPTELGRVVMIAPPNTGSHIATRLTPLYGWFSPTLKELSDRPESFVNQLPPPEDHVHFGVLAASSDRMVRLPRTHLTGQRDHCVVKGHHTPVLWRRETAEKVDHFLQHGAFARAPEADRVESQAPAGVAPA